MRPNTRDPLVRRAGLQLAGQAAALVAVAMLLLIAVVTLLVVRSESRATDAVLRSTAAAADDVGDPPSGAWIVLDSGHGVAVSPSLPGDISPELAQLRRTAPPRSSLSSISDADGDDFRVLTARRNGGIIQVAIDLRPQEAARHRLIQAMTAASAVALLLSAVLGGLLGRRAVRPLADALSLQRAFVADASHELRTPLTLLSTRTQVLDAGLQARGVDPGLRADSAGVLADVRRLGQVIDDLLAAADPDRREQHELLDLVDLVHSVVASAQPSAGEAGVRLTVAPTAGPMPVRGAAPALRRAVLALLDNAIDHTRAGGSVRLGVRTQRGTVVVAVSDTGPGVAPQDAARVLRRFHSGGHRAGRSHYGLGLALCGDVAERHGGQVRLAPSAVGATFELVLPAAGSRSGRTGVASRLQGSTKKVRARWRVPRPRHPDFQGDRQ